MSVYLSNLKFGGFFKAIRFLRLDISLLESYHFLNDI
jgi:hypothetical protein